MILWDISDIQRDGFFLDPEMSETYIFDKVR